MSLKDHLEKLYYFKIAADLGSFHKASTFLNLTQPSLSSSIKILETSIGTKLFIRTRQGVTLNQHGKELHRYCSQFFLELKELEEKLERNIKNNNHTLKIGFYESVAHYFGPRFFSLFASEVPNVMPQVYTGRSQDLLSMLKSRALDVVVTVEPKSDDLYQSRVLFSDTLSFFVKSKRKASDLNEKQIFELPWIIFKDAKIGENVSLLEIIDSLNLKPTQQICVDSFETALDLTMSGIGVSILPTRVVRNKRWLQHTALSQGSLINIKNHKFGEISRHRIMVSCLSENSTKEPFHEVLDVMVRSVT